jgi:N-acetylglucosaminyl-diphospho-decaprenol L-rhamnosyltransferase
MTSVVIPVFNQLHYTQGCLEGLRRTVPAETKIVIVNNGSTDGTSDFLRQQQGITVIDNKENRGCAASWNQGIKVFPAEWTVILNNDVLLPAGWLDALLSSAKELQCQVISPGIREGEMNYDLEAYAREFVTRMAGVARHDVATGICFMVHRTVFERAGEFDENFRIGQFEDSDFFLRARLAGFRLATTGRSFIHHFGSMTQKSLRADKKVRPYESENRAYFRKKWNLTAPKRLWLRTRTKTSQWVARTKERCVHGHSLNEKWIAGKLHYF